MASEVANVVVPNDGARASSQGLHHLRWRGWVGSYFYWKALERAAVRLFSGSGKIGRKRKSRKALEDPGQRKYRKKKMLSTTVDDERGRELLVEPYDCLP